MSLRCLIAFGGYILKENVGKAFATKPSHVNGRIKISFKAADHTLKVIP